MKDNIKQEFIQNRKLIIEIRYVSNPRILDERGALINKLVSANIIANSHWELGGTNITVMDKLDQNESRRKIYIDLSRLSFISTIGETNASFYAGFEKAFKIFKETIEGFKITRVGCRIQGSYSCESKDSKTIIEKFKNYFPNQFLLEEFPAQDLRFQLVYQNGMYHIGPIRKNDLFLKQEFPYSERIDHIGFGIDTDNYLLKQDDEQNIKENRIKDVLLTSLSVEKSLFDKLKSL